MIALLLMSMVIFADEPVVLEDIFNPDLIFADDTQLYIAVLQRALQKTTDVNSLLRTLLIWENVDEPVQVIDIYRYKTHKSPQDTPSFYMR